MTIIGEKRKTEQAKKRGKSFGKGAERPDMAAINEAFDGEEAVTPNSPRFYQPINGKE